MNEQELKPDSTQDLRERAEELLDSALDYDEWKNPIWKDADVINAMLQFASEVSAEQLDNIVETLYSHYKNNGGYTRTAASFIQKITGKKWERDDELKEAYKQIARLEQELEERL